MRKKSNIKGGSHKDENDKVSKEGYVARTMWNPYIKHHN